MKRNEYAEPTEMAGIAEADTEMAYAWALDYDDPDESPTQRLTSRRITSLGLAASLLLIAVAGVVALLVVRDTSQQETAPSPITSATAAPPPVITTATPPPPPLRPPNPVAEARFVADVFAQIPTADIPGGRPTDSRLIAYGYQACSMMDQYPNPVSAAEPFYEQVSREAGYTRDPAKISKTSAANEVWFMTIAAQDLCNAGAPPPPPPPVTVTVQAPPPVRTVEPPPAVQAGCTEGATKYSQASEITYTCENGQWHEGPYGYGGGG